MVVCEGMKPLKVELTSAAAEWVQAEIAAGHFLNAEEAINHAINKVKLVILRDELATAVADPHRYSMDDAKAALAAERANLAKEGF